MIQAFPVVFVGGDRPSLDLRFAALKQLDPRVTFTRASSGTYIDEAGTVQTAGTNVPRFTHDPVTGASLGLLIEEARTNSILRSEAFENASWSRLVSTNITSNAEVAPDGQTSGDAVVETANTVNFGVFQSNATTGAIIVSVFAKAAARSWLHLQTDKTAIVDDAWVNLSTGAVGTVTSGSVAVTQLGNGWHRIAWAFTATRSNNIAIYAATANGVNTYAGTASTQAIFIWGAQLEAGVTASSYIATAGVSATRAADVVTMSGGDFSSWYNQAEGTLVADYFSSGTSAGKFFLIQARTDDMSGGLGLGDAATRTAEIFIPSFSMQASFATSLPVVSRRAALAYRANDFCAAFSGVLASPDTAGSLPVPTTLYIGTSPSAGQRALGVIARISYYKKRLPNAALVKLST